MLNQGGFISMHEIKNILNSSLSQSENALSKAFVPKTTKASHFRYRKRIKFADWAGQPIAPNIIGLHNLKKTIGDLSVAQRRILELFIYMRSRGLPNWMSQEYIGKLLGYSRVHINRSVQNLRAWGFIDIYNRGRDVSNVYKVANVFMDKNVWSELMIHMPILKSFFLLFCLVQPVLNPYPHEFFWASQSWKPKNVTLLILDDNKINNIKGIDTQKVEQTKSWISNLVTSTEKRDEFRDERVRREKMKYEYKPQGALSSFKNMHKRDVKRETTSPSIYLLQEAERISAEKVAREALLAAERGTEKEAANNALAAENLRRLFGI